MRMRKTQEPKTASSGLDVTYKVKRSFLYLLLFCSLCVSLPLAKAQNGAFDISVGLGAAHDKAIGSGISNVDLSSCSPAVNGSNCVPTRHLAGVMMGFNGNYMFTKYLGAGAEVSFQPAKQDYAVLFPASSGQAETLQSRLTFYDFNGIAQPFKNKLAALQISGGFGGANLKFYDNLSASTVLGNLNSSSPLTSANHFQLHVGVGVPIYVKDHFFIRPQFDIHYVPNFTQFGNNLVTQGMVYVGYSFGGESTTKY